ncbi:MAG TPA: DUF4112 domain-containing protein [Pirellulales bacterium]|nr:DUF4112 domain-containing protein [Pirellulales bacterium]
MVERAFSESSGGIVRRGSTRHWARGQAAPNTAEIQAFVEKISRLMDTAFEVPGLGWRFGFDALVGLIPGIGDLATTLVSLYLLLLASRTGLPRITLARMGLNVAIDMVGGSLPLVGDIFDVWWKSNQKNAALLRERLAAAPYETPRAKASDWIFVGGMIVALIGLFAAVIAVATLIVAAVWNLVRG